MIKTLANIVLISILGFCIYKVSIKEINYAQDVRTYGDIQEIATRIELEQEYTLADEMRSLNSDYIAWIQIENTSVDYPVVQTTDNQLYLKNDFNKNESISGTIYLDYRNQLTDENLIIYGHNMRNQTMFEPLEQFKEKVFFEQNNKIFLTVEAETHIYEVFSVYVVSSDNDILVPQFSNEQQYDAYLNKIADSSLFTKDTSLNSTDKILTLYTCSYETSDSRTIIHAKQIKTDLES